jgi:4-hydroxy-2-oxoheptanedioate aldolase
MSDATQLRAALDGDRMVTGTWLSLASSTVAEVLSHCGFRWLLIDQQHALVGTDGLLQMVHAVESGGASPVVRIPANRPEYIGIALDVGADAVMVPMVSSASDAEQALGSMRYPPGGVRSIGGYRAAMVANLTRAEYYRRASQRVSAWVQIEDAAGVERAGEIMQVEGVDVCFVGPQDLSASLGLMPSLEPDSDVFEAALDTVVQAAAGTTVRLGLLVPTAESAMRRWTQGFQVIAVSTDAAMLATAGRQALGRAG